MEPTTPRVLGLGWSVILRSDSLSDGTAEAFVHTWSQVRFTDVPSFLCSLCCCCL